MKLKLCLSLLLGVGVMGYAQPAPPIIRSPTTTNYAVGLPANGEVPIWDLAGNRWDFQVPPGAVGGEANTAENLGALGAGVYSDKVGVALQFNRIGAGLGLTLASNANVITLTPTVQYQETNANLTLLQDFGPTTWQATNDALTALAADPNLYQATNGNLTLLQAYGPTYWQQSNANLTLLQAYGPTYWQQSNANLTLLQAYGPTTWQATNTLTDWTAGNVTYVPLAGDIQTYINAATAGDTLILASGNYAIVSDLVVSKSLNIVGQGSAGYGIVTPNHGTVISSATAGVTAFQIDTNNTRIANLSINLTGAGCKGITTSNNLVGLVFRDIDLVVNASGSVYGFRVLGSDAILQDVDFAVTSSDSTAGGLWFYNNSSTTKDAVVTCFTVGGTTDAGAFYSCPFVAENVNDANTLTLNLQSSVCRALESDGTDAAVAALSTTTTNVIINCYNCTLDGYDYGAYNDTSPVGNQIFLGGSVMENAAVFGAVEYRATMVADAITSETFTTDELDVSDMVVTNSISSSNLLTGHIVVTNYVTVGGTNVTGELALKAPLASPVLTGDPTAPTAAEDDSDTSIATTAFVQQEISGVVGYDINALKSTTDETDQTISTNALVDDSTIDMEATVVGAGPTNSIRFVVAAGFRNVADVGSMIGLNQYIRTNYSTAELATNVWWTVAGETAVLNIKGFTNENMNWKALGNIVYRANGLADTGGGTTYLVSKSFLTGLLPDGWTDYGGNNYAYTPALEGSYSAQYVTVANAKYSISETFTAQSEIWGYMMVQMAAYPLVDNNIFQFRDSTTYRLLFAISTTGKLRISYPVGAGTDDSIPLDTPTHLWFYAKQGTGDAIYQVAWSTDGTKPLVGTKFKEVTTGTWTTDVDRIRVGPSTTDTWTLILDKVRVDDVAIGDNPE